VCVLIYIGPIGLVSLLAAKAMGASQVIISGNVFIHYVSNVIIYVRIVHKIRF